MRLKQFKKLCDFSLSNTNSETKCHDGFAKYKAIIYSEDTEVETKNVCRFCLDRFLSEKTKQGFKIVVEPIKE